MNIVPALSIFSSSSSFNIRASLVAQLVKNLPAMQETWVQSLGWEDPWRGERLPTPVFWPGEFHGLLNGVTKNLTQLSNFHFHFFFLHPYEVDPYPLPPF